jgi:hypothetical protein
MTLLPPSTLDELRGFLMAARYRTVDPHAGRKFEEEAVAFLETLLDGDHPSHRRVVADLREYLAR